MLSLFPSDMFWAQGDGEWCWDSRLHLPNEAKVLRTHTHAVPQVPSASSCGQAGFWGGPNKTLASQAQFSPSTFVQRSALQLFKIRLCICLFISLVGVHVPLYFPTSLTKFVAFPEAVLNRNWNNTTSSFWRPPQLSQPALHHVVTPPPKTFTLPTPICIRLIFFELEIDLWWTLSRLPIYIICHYSCITHYSTSWATFTTRSGVGLTLSRRSCKMSHAIHKHTLIYFIMRQPIANTASWSQ